MSLNRAQLIGNLTRDPEVKQIPGGATVASFSIATNFTWSDASGQKQERAEYHNIVAWRKLAEICSQYLKKGSKVFIEGRIQTRDWEGEDGVKRYRTEIVADNMIMLDRKGAPMGSDEGFTSGARANFGQSSHSGIRRENSPGNAAETAPVGAEEISIDDLPF